MGQGIKIRNINLIFKLELYHNLNKLQLIGHSRNNQIINFFLQNLSVQKQITHF